MGVIVVILLHYASHSIRSYRTKFGNEDIIIKRDEQQYINENNKDTSSSPTKAQAIYNSTIDIKGV